MSFVGEHRDRFGVEPILRVLEVPVSTFYGWEAQQRNPCQRRRQDAWLAGKIRAVHTRSGGTYGAPRVHAQLCRDGVRVSRKRVARLMGACGLQGAFVRKRWRCSTRQDPTATPAPDLVNRQFTATRPNFHILLPGGLTESVPIIATGITGTPVSSASRASPVLPL